MGRDSGSDGALMGLYDDNPCKGCVAPKRHLGCHATCKEHADWKAVKQDAYDIINRERKRDSLVLGLIVDSQRRVDKRLKIKK